VVKKKLFWVGDAGCTTGFAGVTHNVLDRIWERWDVGVLGINYRGDPHEFPYKLYPAGRDGDVMGFKRFRQLVRRARPDVIFIHQDPWWICAYLESLAEALAEMRTSDDAEERAYERPKVVGYMPVDTKGEIRQSQAEALSVLDFALFYTQFAVEEAKAAGLRCPAGAAYLGVDPEFFSPVPRGPARERTGLTASVGEGFLVGNVNRNQFRKRLDLTVRVFAEWQERFPHPDAFLYMHTNRIEQGGWNLRTLADYYGLGERLFYPTTIDGWDGADAYLMSSVYSSFDVQITTTLGEGWGLTQLEGLACGVPQVAPNWSALGEWMTHGSVLIPCRDTLALTGLESNGIGGVVDTRQMAGVLERLYRDRKMVRHLGEEGRDYARSDKFSWALTAAICEQVLLRVTAGADGPAVLAPGEAEARPQ
jgi:D-inositol-3-phosphate glycosyltransferase